MSERELPRVPCHWNNLDGQGRIRLTRIDIEEATTPSLFDGDSVLFAHGSESGRGTLERLPGGEWIGIPDWETQSDEDEPAPATPATADEKLDRARRAMAHNERDEAWLGAKVAWRVELRLWKDDAWQFTSGEGIMPEDALDDLVHRAEEWR